MQPLPGQHQHQDIAVSVFTVSSVCISCIIYHLYLYKVNINSKKGVAHRKVDGLIACDACYRQSSRLGKKASVLNVRGDDIEKREKTMHEWELREKQKVQA